MWRLKAEIRPRIGAAEAAGDGCVARDRGAGGGDDDGADGVAGGDLVVAGVATGAVLDDQAAGRIDIDAAGVIRHVVGLDAIVCARGMDARSVAGAGWESIAVAVIPDHASIADDLNAIAFVTHHGAVLDGRTATGENSAAGGVSGRPIGIEVPADRTLSDGALRPGGNPPRIRRGAGVQRRGAIRQRTPIVGSDAELDAVAVCRAAGQGAAFAGKNSVGAGVVLGRAVGQATSVGRDDSIAGIRVCRAVDERAPRARVDPGAPILESRAIGQCIACTTHGANDAAIGVIRNGAVRNGAASRNDAVPIVESLAAVDSPAVRRAEAEAGTTRDVKLKKTTPSRKSAAVDHAANQESGNGAILDDTSIAIRVDFDAIPAAARTAENSESVQIESYIRGGDVDPNARGDSEITG